MESVCLWPYLGSKDITRISQKRFDDKGPYLLKFELPLLLQTYRYSSEIKISSRHQIATCRSVAPSDIYELPPSDITVKNIDETLLMTRDYSKKKEMVRYRLDFHEETIFISNIS